MLSTPTINPHLTGKGKRGYIAVHRYHQYFCPEILSSVTNNQEWTSGAVSLASAPQSSRVGAVQEPATAPGSRAATQRCPGFQRQDWTLSGSPSHCGHREVPREQRARGIFIVAFEPFVGGWLASLGQDADQRASGGRSGTLTCAVLRRGAAVRVLCSVTKPSESYCALYNKIPRNGRQSGSPAWLLLNGSSLHPAPCHLGSDPVIIDINTLFGIG